MRLFSTILRKDADGYVLVTPAEKMRITVEDAPFIAVLMDVEGEGRDQTLTFTTNVGDETIAGADNPIRVETDPRAQEPAPYVHVRARVGSAHRARRVLSACRSRRAGRGRACGLLGVWSGGVFFPIGDPNEHARNAAII